MCYFGIRYLKKKGLFLLVVLLIQEVNLTVLMIFYYPSQGRTQNLMWVGSFLEKVDLFDGAGVQSTPSMQSMLKLGGSGGMPPQENFEK